MCVMLALSCLGTAGGSPSNNVCDIGTEKCAHTSDEILLMQAPSFQRSMAPDPRTLGLDSEVALNLIQNAIDLMPSDSVAPSRPDILQFLAAAGVMRNGSTTHLSDHDTQQLVNVSVLLRTLFLDNAIEAKDLDQRELDEYHANMLACGINMTSAITATNASLERVENARTTHSDCRTEESSLMSENTTKWNAYNDLSQYQLPECTSLPTGVADMVENIVESSPAYSAWLKNTSTLFENNKMAYMAARKAFADQRSTCTNDQNTFEQEACVHAYNINSVCSEYDECFDARLETYNDTKRRVKNAVTKRKEFVKSLEAIACHIEVILNHNSGDHSFTKCSNLTANLTAHEITYPEDVAKKACDLPGPGTVPDHDEWEDKQYRGEQWYADVTLAPATACTGM